MGRLAQCPACQATFRVGEPDAPELAQQEPDSRAQDHQPPHSNQAAIKKINIEQIAAQTWAIFKVSWIASVLSCVIVAAVVAVLLGFPAWVVTSSMANQPLYQAIAVMILIPYALIVTAYALIGICRVHLAIVRGEPQPLHALKTPTDLLIRFLPSYLLLFLVIALIFGFGFGLIVITAAFGSPPLTNFVGVLVAFMLMVAVTVIQWYLWAWMMAASDGKCTAMGSLKVASNIAMQNKVCSFFLVIIAVALSLIGSLTCYVGHIVTSPLTLLLFAVGYLLATNQPTADPVDD